MKTIWGNSLNPDSPLSEYPRPQMVRDSWLCLNGRWQYAVNQGDCPPDKMSGEIIVPFSPESELSGANCIISPKDILWYKRTFTLDESFSGGRVLLHFGAVDQTAEVFVNGIFVGAHVGGYTAFSFDITDAIKAENELVVKVRDLSDSSWQSKGKQKLKRGGIWYTPQSGIWQTVWCESVPREYISRLSVTPLFDSAAVEVTAHSNCECECTVTACGNTKKGRTNVPIILDIGEFTPWSPDEPKLYDLEVSTSLDSVKSYFGMRKFEVKADSSGIKRMYLNNRPFFHNGVLDQGYWSDGLYTAPSDEAMIYDIVQMKELGFNMLRKHIKIEPMRWYYHCDRLGMLVWQDMVNGGGHYNPLVITLPVLFGMNFSDSSYGRFARKSEIGRNQYMTELNEMLVQLQNVVSLSVWVPFNEGWGQFDAAKIYDTIKELDPTRPVDHASGWHDQGSGDFKSLHVYFKPYRFKPDKLGRAVILSEFGGYAHRVSEHSFCDRDFGYKKFSTPEALKSAFIELYENEIIPAKERGLCASVYTQLSDVEDELNGFITYDRRISKLSARDIRSTVKKLND
ncbi:MAG: glycoside hydrolase family 2 TIM barrel-domain containing protein [Oscillospiraceae bacterium]